MIRSSKFNRCSPTITFSVVLFLGLETIWLHALNFYWNLFPPPPPADWSVHNFYPFFLASLQLKKIIIWFIYLCLALLELPYRVGFSLVPESRATLPLWACRLRELWFPGSGAQTQSLRLTGLVALRHVGSSWIRDRTHAPCFDRWILYDWATRETLQLFFFFF